MEQNPSVELKFITAPSDGVGPAILLTISRGKPHITPIQYLVNVPEGFSRLVLEHRCRPGPGLRALFLTDLAQAQGGLGGLLLRLRQDGHAALRLVGPAGLHNTVEGLTYFVRWMHPALELTALTSAQQGCVYGDEFLEVRPIWSSSLLWQVPPWLNTAADAEDSLVAAGTDMERTAEDAIERPIEAELPARIWKLQQGSRAPGAASAAAAGPGKSCRTAEEFDSEVAEAKVKNKEGPQRFVGAKPPANGSEHERSSTSTAWDSGSCSTASASSGGADDPGGDSGRRRRPGRGWKRDTSRCGPGPRSLPLVGKKGVSSEGSSSSTSSSSSSSESDEDEEGLTGKATKRRRQGGNNAAAVATLAVAGAGAVPTGCSGSRSAEDLFSKLDRLFATNTMKQPGCGANSAVHRQVPALGPAEGPSVAFRSLVLEELRTAASEQRAAEMPSQSSGRRTAAAMTNLHKISAAYGKAATRVMLGPAPPPPPALASRPHPRTHSLRPAARPPGERLLAYLIYLKSIRKALLVIATGETYSASLLASHPVTALLRRASPELLLAVVPLGVTDEVHGVKYCRLIQENFPGPHVWPNGNGAVAHVAAAMPYAGLGHVSSTRVVMRLNAVAPTIFPLPYQLRMRQIAAARRTVNGQRAGRISPDEQLEAAIAAAAAAAAAPPSGHSEGVASSKGLTQYAIENKQQHGEQLKNHQQTQKRDGAERLVKSENEGKAAETKTRQSCKAAAKGSRKVEPFVFKGRIAALLDTLTCAHIQASGGCATAAAAGTCSVAVGRCRVRSGRNLKTQGREPEAPSPLASSSSSSSEEEEEEEEEELQREQRQRGWQQQQQQEHVAVVSWGHDRGDACRSGAGGTETGPAAPEPTNDSEPAAAAGDRAEVAVAAVAAEAEAGVVSEPLLPLAEEVQSAMLQKRCSSGLPQMLLAFRRSCRRLVRSTEAFRLLAALAQQGERTTPERANVKALRVKKEAELLKIEVSGLRGKEEGTGGDPLTSLSVPRPRPQLQPSQQVAPFVGSGGGWQVGGPELQGLPSAEAELAAAVAAYGIPETTGTIMRPLYSYSTFRTDDRDGGPNLLPPKGGYPPYLPPGNGGMYGKSWSAMNPPSCNAESSWPAHPSSQPAGTPYALNPNRSNPREGNGWAEHHRPLPPNAGIPKHVAASYSMSYRNVVPQPGGAVFPSTLWPWPDAQPGSFHPSGAANADAAVATATASVAAAATAPGCASANNKVAAAGLRSLLRKGLGSGDSGSGGGGRVASLSDGAYRPESEVVEAAGKGAGGSDREALNIRCEDGGGAVRDGEADRNRVAARRVRRRLMDSVTVHLRTASGTSGPDTAHQLRFSDTRADGLTDPDPDRPNSTLTARGGGGGTHVAEAVRMTTEGHLRPSEEHTGTGATAKTARTVERWELPVLAAVAPQSQLPQSQSLVAQDGNSEAQAVPAGSVAATDAPSASFPSLRNRGVALRLQAALSDRSRREVLSATSPARSSSGGGGGGATIEQPRRAEAAGSGKINTTDATDNMNAGTANGVAVAAVPAATTSSHPSTNVDPEDVADPRDCGGLSAAARASLESYLTELNGAQMDLLKYPTGLGSYGTAGTRPAATAGAGAAPSGSAVQNADARGNLGEILAPPAAVVDDVPPPACLLPVTAAKMTSPTVKPAPGVKATSPVGDVSILFLGTGSAEPSKYRGASAVLVMQLGPTRGSLLIDAGEGTFGAMVRWLGLRGALEQVASLELIWISHKHPDHLLGLPTLLAARGRGRRAESPLVVVGPLEVSQWLSRVAPLHPSWSYTFLHCSQFSGSAPTQPQPVRPSHQQQHQKQQQQQQQGQHHPIAMPWPPVAPLRDCTCCPPYGIGGSGGGSDSSFPHSTGSQAPWEGSNATAHWQRGGGADGRDGFILTDLMPQSTATSGPGKRPGARPAARLRWHQQQQQQRQSQQQEQQQQQQQKAAAKYVASECCQALGLVRWQSVGVHHCRDAWGLVLEHQDGWKVVYSGDTRPCPALIAAGRGATLLIHEATFEPCLESQARSKRHSTSAEAAAVAEAMGAYRTVLTHFSQRYPRIPGSLDPTILPLRRRPVPAFDGLLLPLAVLRELPHIMPPLALALGEAESSVTAEG